MIRHGTVSMPRTEVGSPGFVPFEVQRSLFQKGVAESLDSATLSGSLNDLEMQGLKQHGIGMLKRRS